MTWLNKARFFPGAAAFCCLAFLLPSAQADSIVLSGAFTADDNIQLFDVSLATSAQVDLRSYGYAGGTSSSGSVVPSGGFDSVLTLFDGAGNLITENDDGAGVASDPSTGLVGDARLTTTLAAGNYILALTQYDNFAGGLTLGDGFLETGHPNFTADPSFTAGGACPGNLFRDISGTDGRCRTGDWTVDFTNVASATERTVAATPEPGSWMLLGLGLLLLALKVTVKRGRQTRAVLSVLPLLSALCLTGNLRAQQQQQTDFSNVKDVLNGNRTLLKISDVALDQNGKSGYLPTSNNTPGAERGVNTYNGIVTGRPVAAAKVFDVAGDTVVSVVQHDESIYLSVRIPGVSDPRSIFVYPQIYHQYASCYNDAALAVRDIDGDGYSDIALIISGVCIGNSNKDKGSLGFFWINTYTAVDPKTPKQGLRLARSKDLSSAFGVNRVFLAVIANLKGNSNLSLAMLSQDFRDRYDYNGIPRLTTFELNRDLTVADGFAQIDVPDSFNGWTYLSLDVGRFADADHVEQFGPDQLLVAWGNEANYPVKATVAYGNFRSGSV